jgi:radical SAM superfamily enzyme YgiQ (UPF0313 family)
MGSGTHLSSIIYPKEVMRIASAQPNYAYGDQIHFPYSIGCILAYAESALGPFEIIPCFVHRERISENIQHAAQADWLLCSTYSWNAEITDVFARSVKDINPNIKVVYGGPQVPDKPYGFLDNRPFVDFLIHNEGEIPLVTLLQGGTCGPGITSRCEVGPPPVRLADLSILPSPYLSGVIDRLAPHAYNLQWVGTLETNKGCPYSCQFCTWGSAVFTKLRYYPLERIFSEIEWFGQRRIPYIDCADANFALPDRDYDIAVKFRDTALTTGFPHVFRQSWAKNSSEKVITVAKELQAGGLLSAVGLAVQSLDPTTLKEVKRKNLPFGQLSDLTKKFKDANIDTYSEVIRGLPGETLESFKNGLGIMASDSYIGTIYIYHCSVLNNAPMQDSAYQIKHGIKTIRSPIYLAHSSIHGRSTPEFEHIITATNTMSEHDMHSAFMFSWAILIGESLAMFKEARKMSGLNCVEFYDRFINACQVENGVFHDEYMIVHNYATAGYNGQGWNHHDPQLGDIYWPIEEASWLRLVNSPVFQSDIGTILYRMGINNISIVEAVHHLAERPLDVDLPTWAREHVWWGRRKGKFLKKTGQ